MSEIAVLEDTVTELRLSVEAGKDARDAGMAKMDEMREEVNTGWLF